MTYTSWSELCRARMSLNRAKIGMCTVPVPHRLDGSVLRLPFQADFNLDGWWIGWPSPVHVRQKYVRHGRLDGWTGISEISQALHSSHCTVTLSNTATPLALAPTALHAQNRPCRRHIHHPRFHRTPCSANVKPCPIFLDQSSITCCWTVPLVLVTPFVCFFLSYCLRLIFPTVLYTTHSVLPATNGDLALRPHRPMHLHPRF